VTTVVVNGSTHPLTPQATGSLLDWLREDLKLTGTKYACGEAACGACSVLLDGQLARACVVPVSDATGRSVTTIEGLAPEGGLDRLQHAFVVADAMQCGYCTPGMIVAASALLAADPQPSGEAIAEWMASNVCRCGMYLRIVDAIARAADAPSAAAEAEPKFELARQPAAPWDLCDVDARDYFDVLGDGLVGIAHSWVHVSPGGLVTAFTGKVDVGQGTRRALRLAIAEQLHVPLERVRIVMGDTDVCPYDMGTFGSMSMPNALPDLRRAAAAAYAAIQRDGAVKAGDRRVGIAADDIPIATASPPELAGDDIAAVTGAKEFVADVHRPGMEHGFVLRAPRFGARLAEVEIGAARAIEGVTVVVEGGFVGVCAARRDDARRALDAIVTKWNEADIVDEADLESHLRAHPVESDGFGGRFEHDSGDVDAHLASSAVSLDRTYSAAYIAHAPIETRVATAEWNGDRVTVWTGTQRPFGVRNAIASAVGVDETHVRVVVPHTGTGFGGKHEPDVAVSAARLARAAGAPVRVHWSRQEEFTWAYFRPAAVIDIRAGTTSDGDLVAWEFTNINSGASGIGVPYAVTNQRLRFEPADSPLRQGAYRALASTANNFARESLIDELAHELDVDPLVFRLRNLNDDRLADVLRAVCERFGWQSHPRDTGYGVGLAVGTEKTGRSATCVLVRVEGARLEILRVATAFECGAVVDPENLRKQVEGATVMGLGGALFEAIHFADGVVTNPRFSEYRIPRFTDIPPIETILVDRADIPAAGGGETPIITIAPALANAIFDATGTRIRSLPLLEHASLEFGRPFRAGV
jgi:isoquinoline 1-oxidoreductase